MTGGPVPRLGPIVGRTVWMILTGWGGPVSSPAVLRPSSHRSAVCIKVVRLLLRLRLLAAVLAVLLRSGNALLLSFFLTVRLCANGDVRMDKLTPNKDQQNNKDAKRQPFGFKDINNRAYDAEESSSGVFWFLKPCAFLVE
uniref:Uncharacterized protein n=1 Tax=Aegilops tauschii TaxID=37682 RepID=R7WFM3_AEGTA